MKQIREEVKKHYGDIAKRIELGGQGCCGTGGSCCSSISSTSINYDIEYLKDLPKEAIQASLGCANPLVLAELAEGEVVLDLGSGGGIDVLAASKYVGATGKIYGLDMTDEMLNLANENKKRMGVSNVEFIKGFIEDIPLSDSSVDVVMSNCVVNLSGDKEAVMREVYRVLKPNGRLAIADIVSTREVPDELRQMTALWVGCIAGAMDVKDFEAILNKEGFKDINISPEHYYTKEVLHDLGADESCLSDEQWKAVDGAFAGAFIKAVK